MTCIIGIEFEGKVYLAGDKLGSNGWTGSEYHCPKVFENGDGIFGYTSSYRWGQLLEFGLTDVLAPKDINEMHRWMVTSLVPSIQKVLKGGDYNDKGKNALIGINGQLWEHQDDLSVLRSTNGYAAIGSGETFANAIMGYAMKNHPPRTVTEVEELLRSAMETVGHHCTSVGSECYIVSK